MKKNTAPSERISTHCATAYTTAATCTIPGVEKIFDAKICGNENYGSLQEQYGRYGLALALSCGDEM